MAEHGTDLAELLKNRTTFPFRFSFVHSRIRPLVHGQIVFSAACLRSENGMDRPYSCP